MKLIYVGLEVEEEMLTPTYAHPDSDAGADLRASVDGTILAGEYGIVPTGVKIAMEPGVVGLVHPRSGLAARNGVTVLNAPGTIDAGYRGEIKVILHNTSNTDFHFKKYDRIAQIVFQEVLYARFNESPFTGGTVRDFNGFGSTGVN